MNAANRMGVTPLMEACAKERLSSVELLVKAPGLNLVQVDKNGDSALHHAFNVQLQKLFGDKCVLLCYHLAFVATVVCGMRPCDLIY